MLDRLAFVTALAACSSALADGNAPKHNDMKKMYSPEDRAEIAEAEKELGRMVSTVNSDGSSGVNQKLRVRKPGQDDRYVPLPEDQQAHITASIDWDSFHDHVDEHYSYKYVGEHCVYVVFGLSRFAEYSTNDYDTRQHLLAQLRDEIKKVRCRYDAGAFVDPKTKWPTDVLRLGGGVLTAGYNWDTANKEIETRVKEWIQAHL